MPEEILFSYEGDKSRQEIATYLRTVAEKLEGEGEITLEAGDDSVTLEPPATAEFEVKAEREGAPEGPKELSIELEFEWPEDGEAGGDGSLSIE